MASKASALREDIKVRFYPFAENLGYARQKSRHPLFTRFERERGGELQWFELQWDKYHKPCFVVNFGHHPVGAHDAPLMGRLQRWRGGGHGCWFGLHRPWRTRLLTLRWSYRPDEAATELLAAFPELDRWFDGQPPGPHLHLFGC